MGSVYAALVHYPIRDREGATVTTAVTNLDVHDIARSARSYGLKGYYVVTPIEAQRVLVDRILEHWRSGAGARRVPERTVALSLTHIVPSIEAAIAHIEAAEGQRPRVVVTGAKAPEGGTVISHAEERETLRTTAVPTLLIFGTGHGLARSVVDAADGVLAPIQPGSDYNHLSVRAAAAIFFDRLLGAAQ